MTLTSATPRPAASITLTLTTARRSQDPYRWLEDDVRNSPEVAEWVKAENQLTESYLAAIPSARRSAAA